MTTALAPSRAAQATKTTIAAVLTVGLVVGLPWGLIAYAGTPWSWHLPSAARWDIALSWPPSEHTIGWALILICWTTWLGLAIALAKETVLQIAGRRAASQIHGPIRLLAAALTGTIAATTPAIAASAAPDTVATAPIEECEAPDLAPAEGTATDEAAAVERDAEGNIIHTVTKNQTLWGLADHYYGDPTAYPRIFSANKDIAQADGNTLLFPDFIRIGWKLVIPGTAPSPDTETPQPEPAKPAPPISEAPDQHTSPPAQADTHDDTATPDDSQSDSHHDEDAAPAFGRGAWLTAGSFIALSAAATALAIRRRRRGAADTDATNDEPELETSTAPTPVAEEVFTGRLVELEALLEHHQTTEPDTEPAPALATGTTETNEITVLDHAHGGLGLTGAGAPGVALAALWSALASGATVLTATTTAEHLGLDSEATMPPNLRLLDEPNDLAGAISRAQARLEYEPDTDNLTQRATIVITSHDTATQLPAALLDHESTYAIILGKWAPAWLDLAADGTPLDGHLDTGPVTGLGQCYLLDAATCNDLIADLTTPPETTPKHTADTPAPDPHIETDAPAPAPSETTNPEPDTPGTRRRFALTLFGRHRLTWDGEEVHFGRSACLDMIAVFALNDWRLTRDELSEVVAPDATIKQAGPRRTSAVSEARAQLRNLTGDNKVDFITYDRSQDRYHLDATWFCTDLDTITDHLQRAAATEDPRERADHLQRALHHYTGPLGADLDDAWDLIDQRRHWQETAYRAALELAAIHHDTGDSDRAAAYLERACAIAPDQPTAWERLANHHRKQGNTTKAEQIEARARHHREMTRLARRPPGRSTA